MLQFEQKFEEWLQKNIYEDKNHRRREILKKGLGHGTIEFLRTVKASFYFIHKLFLNHL